MSNIMEEGPSVKDRIAVRVGELREAKALSIDELARRSGVSRSMISLIERGETSPTAVVLDKLALALDVTLASLFDSPASTVRLSNSPVSRRKDQVEWRDPQSGYKRRNVSPSGVSQFLRITEVHFPAGASVAFETVPGNRLHEQVWVLEGAMEITLGRDTYRLHAGDCLAVELDNPAMFRNPTRKQARYAVVISGERESRR
jgi:transcriptional regulator with XRE-family HTH domain